MMKRKYVCGLFAIVILLCCSCSDELDIKQDYNYRIETLPLPQKLAVGEMINLEFSIIRDGHYAGALYKFRYFQSDGTGLLMNGTGEILAMNRFHTIASDDFVLTYQCTCEEQQQLDFVFEDSFGKRVEYTVTFAGKRAEEGKK